MGQNELVLVVPAADVPRLEGFTVDVGRFLPGLFRNASFRQRSDVETDPTWLQLIPYVLLRHGGRLFHYTRGTAGGEQRLHAKRSIGLGGHINPADADGGDPYRAGMLRELAEEVCIETRYTEALLGLVHDPMTPVGQVHLGVVHCLTLADERVKAVDPAVCGAAFGELATLSAESAAFETWSQIVLDAIGPVRRLA